MQLTVKPVRATGFVILAAATVLSAGACSKSHDAKSSDTSSASSGSSGNSVSGLVASVSGNAVEVTEASGTAKVDVSSAKIDEFSEAALSDVTTGSCVRVVSKPAPAAGGPVTAETVRVNPPESDGKCWQPKVAAASAPRAPRTVIGPVASVTDKTIHVTVTDANGNPSQTDVIVDDNTRFTKSVATTSQSIAQGKCITAHGTRDGDTLKATVAALGPAVNGKCPQPAGAKPQ